MHGVGAYLELAACVANTKQFISFFVPPAASGAEAINDSSTVTIRILLGLFVPTLLLLFFVIGLLSYRQRCVSSSKKYADVPRVLRHSRGCILSIGYAFFSRKRRQGFQPPSAGDVAVFVSVYSSNGVAQFTQCVKMLKDNVICGNEISH